MNTATLVSWLPFLAQSESVPTPPTWLIIGGIGLGVGLVLLSEFLGLRYISNNRVGVVEKLWSPKGSVAEGRIIALNGEAGFQADVLRGGVHFGFWRWQYRIHKVPLVTVPQGKIGYVYARDGEPLAAQPDAGQGRRLQQLPGRPRVPDGHRRQSGREPRVGQRGRQRAILREGVYAINLALFVVITEEVVYRLDFQGSAS